MTDTIEFRKCEKCGQLLQKSITIRNVDMIVPVLCKCQMHEREREEEKRLEQERHARICRLREQGLPDLTLRNATFSSLPAYNPKEREIARRYAAHFSEMKDSGTGLLIWGDIGTGKTYLAACIANELIDNEYPVLMTSVSRIMNGMTGLFSESRNNYLDGLGKYDLVTIDDLGIERNTEYSLEQMYTVIDSRYRSGKPMIITTNLTPEEMKNAPDYAHRRIYDRILERCVPLKVNNMNIRQQKADRIFAEAKALIG